MKISKSNCTFEDFAVGSRVKIVSECVDFYFFYGETGKVIKNDGSYLGIIVEFDKPREFKDGSIQKTFNFNPNNLIPVNRKMVIVSQDEGNLKIGSKK